MHDEHTDARVTTVAGASPLVLGLVLAALLGLRAALAAASGMWLWGLDAMRFLPPLAAWLPWALAALALWPTVGRRLRPAMARLGDGLVAGGARAPLGAALLTAALVLAFPDRAFFTGDFVQRNEAIARGTSFLADYPETLPLDLALHVELPRALDRRAHVDPRLTLRLLGALEAALLGALAVALVRALALSGSEAALVVIATVAGGALTLFTGFGKCAGELCMLTVFSAVAAARVLVRHRPAMELALALGAGLALHRFTVLLLPAGLVILLLSARALAPGEARRPRVWLPLVGGAALAMWALPMVVRIIRDYDLEYHLDSSAQRVQGGLLAASFAGVRALDMANLLVFFAPLLPLALVAALAGGRALARDRALWATALVAAPLFVALPLLHPRQGLARDLDVTAPVGMAVVLLAAIVVRHALAARPRAGWLAVPAALACLSATVQWLALNADVERSLTRAVRFVQEAPRRDEVERARFLAYVGDRYALMKDWRRCAVAYGLAARGVPSPASLLKWGLAARLAGDLPSAERAFREMLTRQPDHVEGWYRLGRVALDRGDRAGALEALGRLRALADRAPHGRDWLGALEREMAAAGAAARPDSAAGGTQR